MSQLIVQPAKIAGGEAWLSRWLDAEQTANAVIDQRRRLLWANAKCSEALRAGRDVTLRGGRLETAERRKLETFQAFLDAAPPHGNMWCMERSDGDGHVVFRATHLGFMDDQTVLGLRFHGTGTDFSPRWADYARAFQLTSAEHHVVQLLLEGEVAEGIAGRLKVSLETVRSHIRHAYGKLGASSREQMFRRLEPYRMI